MSEGSFSMLPMWMKQGKTIPLPLTHHRLSLSHILSFTILLGIAFLAHPYLPFFPDANGHDSWGYTTSTFLIPQKQIIPPPNYVQPSEYNFPEPLRPKKQGMVVPNSVHYVYGLKPLEHGHTAEEFPYYTYLAMRSALLNLQPEKIYFHYEHLPTGPWWDLIVPELTLIKTKAPDTYLGRPIEKFAHKADVLRLLAMKWSGGIYLDVDMFVVKSMDDLMYFPTTMGMESSTNMETSHLEPEGLCNAVIISAPHSSFIDRWLASYEDFNKDAWADHSVVKPWELARRYPSEIQVLNYQAFFWPMWSGGGVQQTHEEDDWDFYGSGQYAYHAWESLAMGWLDKLSPDSIRNEDNSFNRLVRPLIGPHDDEVYKRWKGHS